MSKAELTPPSLRSLGTTRHIGVGERVQLELSWQTWHSASFAQSGSEYMRSTKTNSQVGRCPLVLERGHQVRMTTPRPHRGAWRWPRWPDPIWVLSKSWETLLPSLHFWDLPWTDSTPKQLQESGSQLRLPRSSHSPWPAWPRNAREGGRGSHSGSCVVPRSGCPGGQLPRPLPGVLESLGLCPSPSPPLGVSHFHFPRQAQPLLLCPILSV